MLSFVTKEFLILETMGSGFLSQDDKLNKDRISITEMVLKYDLTTKSYGVNETLNVIIPINHI